MFFISYGTRTGSVRDPQGCRTAALRTRKRLTQPELAKLPHERRIWPYGARTGLLRAPQGLFTGCLQSLNPCGARKLICMHWNSTVPVRGGKIRTAPHGARAGPVSGRTIFVQNSPGTTREQPVRGPGVWCDWGINWIHKVRMPEQFQSKYNHFHAIKWIKECRLWNGGHSDLASLS